MSLYHFDTWCYRRYVGWWVLTALAMGLFVSLSWAGSALKVGALLANPESYQSKVVRIEGIVGNHQLKHIKGWAKSVDKCVQSFTVTDGTGEIRAAYAAHCSGAMDLLRNRDKVTVDARFEWTPGKSGTLSVQEIVSKMALQ